MAKQQIGRGLGFTCVYGVDINIFYGLLVQGKDAENEIKKLFTRSPQDCTDCMVKDYAVPSMIFLWWTRRQSAPNNLVG